MNGFLLISPLPSDYDKQDNIIPEFSLVRTRFFGVFEDDSSEKCVKCAGPHSAKEFLQCTLAFDDKLTCANCGGDHAANCRQCPKFPKQGGKKSATPKFKITPHTNRQNTESTRTQQPQGMQKTRQYASYAQALTANENIDITDDIPVETPHQNPYPKSVPPCVKAITKIFTEIFTRVNTLLDEEWCFSASPCI
ncbi:hypothetical protein AVEN_49837-1 [Araneus ventricosus]|uniref:Uncharacterized protein n=1 Tax=Araneus ventricosus TaxID=182803 RepID=A0A4Y2J455_ARAVE|nr:hypothetical protein AVEN_49837-1 [Araneus ventricosus]